LAQVSWAGLCACLSQSSSAEHLPNMDGKATRAIEPRFEEEAAESDGGDGVHARQQASSNSKKGKRRWTTVTNISDFYAPAPYTSTGKGGRGTGTQGRKCYVEESGKGKAQGLYFRNSEAAQKGAQQEHVAKSQSSDAPCLVAADGDTSQPKGGVTTEKKRMGKNRGGGKGGKVHGGERDGGGAKGGGQVPRKEDAEGAGQAPQDLTSLSMLPMATVEQVKRRIQESVGVAACCQKFLGPPDDTELHDEAMLGNYTSPLTLKLVKLSRTINERLLSAACEGDSAQTLSMLKQLTSKMRMALPL